MGAVLLNPAPYAFSVDLNGLQAGDDEYLTLGTGGHYLFERLQFKQTVTNSAAQMIWRQVGSVTKGYRLDLLPSKTKLWRTNASGPPTLLASAAERLVDKLFSLELNGSLFTLRRLDGSTLVRASDSSWNGPRCFWACEAGSGRWHVEGRPL
jgi:hypothetical protein